MLNGTLYALLQVLYIDRKFCYFFFRCTPKLVVSGQLPQERCHLRVARHQILYNSAHVQTLVQFES